MRVAIVGCGNIGNTRAKALINQKQISMIII